MRVARYPWSLLVPALALFIFADVAAALEINGPSPARAPDPSASLSSRRSRRPPKYWGRHLHRRIALDAAGRQRLGHHVEHHHGGRGTIRSCETMFWPAAAAVDRCSLWARSIRSSGEPGLPYLIAYQVNGTDSRHPLPVVPRTRRELATPFRSHHSVDRRGASPRRPDPARRRPLSSP
jgi:hypothetical protein